MLYSTYVLTYSVILKIFLMIAYYSDVDNKDGPVHFQEPLLELTTT